MRVMVAHAHDEVMPPTRFRPDIPADLEQVVLRTLAKNPADRFSVGGGFRRGARGMRIGRRMVARAGRELVGPDRQAGGCGRASKSRGSAVSA